MDRIVLCFSFTCCCHLPSFIIYDLFDSDCSRLHSLYACPFLFFYDCLSVICIHPLVTSLHTLALGDIVPFCSSRLLGAWFAVLFLFFLVIQRPSRARLFSYRTLFRSTLRVMTTSVSHMASSACFCLP